MHTKDLDWFGIILSGACSVHCVGMSFVALFLPTLSLYIQASWVHYFLMTLTLPVAVVAFSEQKKNHGHNAPVIFGLLGGGLLLMGLITNSPSSMLSHQISFLLTVAGSVSLILGHILNIRLARYLS
ncbi:MAG: MerC domain-containing protein [Bdellovibrionales bacterium]|nr:MerC domain-containing protein [Bdellovibrionales bacterium]NQZ19898.1 MerC domain-containing protein [Bdellovibrionales bacterium]